MNVVHIYILTKIAAPPIMAPMATAAVGIEPAASDELVEDADAVALALALSRALLADPRAERREVEAAPLADERLDLMSATLLLMLEASEAAFDALLSTAEVTALRALSTALEALPAAEDN
jgi:hypothetical protein